MIISKKRALISSPIKIETTEASMRWVGEILKNIKGELNDLNLDLAMRLKISENILGMLQFLEVYSSCRWSCFRGYF